MNITFAEYLLYDAYGFRTGSGSTPFEYPMYLLEEEE